MEDSERALRRELIDIRNAVCIFDERCWERRQFYPEMDSQLKRGHVAGYLAEIRC